jgi:hypothetical protein
MTGRGIGRRAGVPPARHAKYRRPGSRLAIVDLHSGKVGDAAPAGFLPVFAGWNVWDVWQADDPDTNLLGTIWHAGESQERLLRVWVEDQVQDNAPGVALADPANPAALKGGQVQPIAHIATTPTSGKDGLAVAATRADIPELAGTLQIGKEGSKATLRTVRFYNRGAQTTMPWAHDANFVVERAYVPSSANPVTNSPPPSSLAGGADDLAKSLASGLKVIAIGAGVVLGVVLAVSLANASRKAAA